METDVPIHPDTLKEQPPVLISGLYENVITFIAGNGWYVLLVAVTCALLWPKVRSRLEKWQEEHERKREAALHHKNPELFRTRQLAFEVARQRMQAEHEAHAARAAELAREREEVKRQERIARLGGAAGHKLSSTASAPTTHTHDAKASTSKPEYNPLMGSGSSSGYHPTRRSCPGGGCG